MGNFYTNVAIKGTTKEEVLTFLRSRYRIAFMTTTDDDWIIIYDRDTDNQDTELLSELAETLALETGSLTFAVLNHDDDILWFQLFKGSDLIAEYATHGGPPTNMLALCRTLGRKYAVVKIWFILRIPMTFEVIRHQLLAKNLGLPLPSVALGYNYVVSEDIPHGLSIDDFTKVP